MNTNIEIKNEHECTNSRFLHSIPIIRASPKGENTPMGRIESHHTCWMMKSYRTHWSWLPEDDARKKKRPRVRSLFRRSRIVSRLLVALGGSEALVDLVPVD